ncbi:oligosaccharide flippase family protein [Vibrio atlanticus]|nr:oligosaccharide flippase family protein [Vibrio atlanticus]
MLSGTAGAQTVAFLAIPIVTRLYGAEAFGILGLFIAFINILNPVSACTLPAAIVLADEDEINDLKNTSKIISLIFSSLVTFVIGFVDYVLKIEISYYFYFIPLAMLLATHLQLLQQIEIRNSRFKRLSISVFITALIVNISKVVSAILFPNVVILIIITTVSPLIQSLLIEWKSSLQIIKNTSYKKFLSKEILAKYKSFPCYKMPQMLLNASAQSLPVIVFGANFGVVFSGYYSLARMVVGVPINLLNKSVGDVFYPKLSWLVKKGECPASEILKITRSLFIISFIPFSILFLYAPIVFGLIFGDTWHIAGQYASWMSLWLIFALINRPSVIAIQVLNFQKEFLIYEVITLAIRLSLLFLVVYYFKDPLIAVISFSVVSAITNAVLILLVYIKAKNK